MKKTFGILTVLTLTLLLVFSACEKENSLFNNQDDAEEEISLKSLEPDVVVKGTGNKADYEKVIVEDIVKNKKCDCEPVEGIIEFYYEDEMVFSVDFGNGDCDGQATVSWLDENNSLQSKVVDVQKIYQKRNRQRNRHRMGKACFELVFPVTFTMPDGSTEITLESKEDKIQIKEWFENNPDYEDEKPSLHFPVDIEYDDGTIVTINNEQEMHEAKENCK